VAQVTVTEEAPDQPEVAALIRALDNFHADLYPAESNHLLSIAELKAAGTKFVVARRDGVAVGTGGLLPRPGYGEIKRMYIAPEARGKGLGREILNALLQLAAQADITVIRLETGVRNAEALSLYRSFGFAERGPFGEYVADPHSIFMERRHLR